MKWVFIIGALFLALGAVSMIAGDGAFKRAVTITGVYSICRPDNYPVVCFLDADGSDGGMFCVPLSTVGGKCKGEK